MIFKILPFFFLYLANLSACTDFIIRTVNGGIINGRSMEFAIPMKTTLEAYPRNKTFSSCGPDGKIGVQWVSKYGCLCATAFGQEVAVDGMNEAGLSFGALWLPGTEYQTVLSEDSQKALDFVDIGFWLLGNFSTVAEVKAAIKNVRIWGHPVNPLSITPPLHLAIHDSAGNSLVVEFIKGKVKLYDNPIGVLTNFPTFDWQLMNLGNYVNLTSFNKEPIDFRGTLIQPTGQGSGLLGIPGDWTPPSRFVRIATLIRFAKQPRSTQEGINLAEHLLNNVDIPKGIIREDDQNEEGDYTQWIVIKDLKEKMMYFRSYQDLSLKCVDLKKLDFKPGAPIKSLSIDQKEGCADKTASLQ